MTRDDDDDVRIFGGKTALIDSGFVDELKNARNIQILKIIGTLGIYRIPPSYDDVTYSNYTNIFTMNNLTTKNDIFGRLNRIQVMIPLKDLLGDDSFDVNGLIQSPPSERSRWIRKFLELVNVVQLIRLFLIIKGLITYCEGKTESNCLERIKIITDGKVVPISAAMIARQGSPATVYIDLLDLGYLHGQAASVIFNQAMNLTASSDYFIRIRNQATFIQLVNWFNHLLENAQSLRKNKVLREYILMLALVMKDLRNEREMRVPDHYTPQYWECFKNAIFNNRHDMRILIKELLRSLHDEDLDRIIGTNEDFENNIAIDRQSREKMLRVLKTML